MTESYDEWFQRRQEFYAQHPPQPQDQMGITYEYVGGPMDGVTEKMHPAMNMRIVRKGYRYVCDFGARKLRSAGAIA